MHALSSCHDLHVSIAGLLIIMMSLWLPLTLASTRSRCCSSISLAPASQLQLSRWDTWFSHFLRNNTIHCTRPPSGQIMTLPQTSRPRTHCSSFHFRSQLTKGQGFPPINRRTRARLLSSHGREARTRHASYASKPQKTGDPKPQIPNPKHGSKEPHTLDSLMKGYILNDTWLPSLIRVISP